MEGTSNRLGFRAGALRRLLSRTPLENRELVVFTPANRSATGADSSSRKPTGGGAGFRVSYITDRASLLALADAARPPPTPGAGGRGGDWKWNADPEDALRRAFARAPRRPGP